MKRIVHLLVILGLWLFAFDSFSQIKSELVDTTIIYEVLNTHIKELAKSNFKDTFFLNRNSKSVNEHDTSKDTKFNIELCPVSYQWNAIHVESRITTLKSSDSIQMKHNTCFMSCPKFNTSKTRCRVYSRIHTGEWGSYSAYFYYRKIRGKWRFQKIELVSIS